MAWKPPTLSDDKGVDPSFVVRCQCRRQVRADMMVRMPPQFVGDAVVYGCDGCRTRLVREGVVTKAQLIEHLDPPEKVLQRLRWRS